MTKYYLYTAIPAILFLATLVWLIVGLIKRSKYRWIATALFLTELSLLAVVYFKYFTAKNYSRDYLNDPVPKAGSLVEIANRKGFFIGAAVNKSDNPVFAQLVPREFNSITPENQTKWRQLLVDGKIGKYDFSEADAIVDYALKHGVRVRGHTLIWGKFSGHTYPKELDGTIAVADDPASELRKVMREHIETVMGHFKGRISTWDAVNEPLSMDGPYLDKNIFLNTLGRSYIAETFKIAHEVDPEATLFLNEQFGTYKGKHVEVFFELLEWLIEAGVPIYGVGIQAHNIFKTHDLDAFHQFIDRVAKLDLKVEVTEFDARIRLFDKFPDPYRAQGEYMAEYARICIENPACIGFTLWGLSDAGTWFDYVPPFSGMPPNDPLLFDTALRPKPAYSPMSKALERRP